MQFKRSIAATAVGAALCAIAGPAAALNPAIDGDADLVVMLSGATAQDPGVSNVIARMCQVNAGVSTLDKYLNASSTQFAYYCRMTPATVPGLSGTLKVEIYKESVVGSANGVVPLLSPGTTLVYMPVTAATIGTCGSAAPVASVTVSGDPLGVPGFNQHTCTPSTTPSQRPIAGLSDVEPPFFTTADTSALAPTSANLLIFGIALTENVYRALQTAQGKDSSTTTADPGNVSSITGLASFAVRDNEANMPSLTRQQISAFLSGNMDWTGIRDNSGNPLTLPADPNFYLARRGNTSGTQKTSEIYALNGSSGRCNVNAPAMPTSGNSSSVICVTPGGVTVFEGGGTGNVRQCLADHFSGGRWAMGLVSVEQSFDTFQVPQHWRYVKLDGFSPSMLNVFNGKYALWSEQSLNKSFDFNAGPWNANQRAVVSTLFSDLGNPTAIKASDLGQRQVWGAGALMQTFWNGGPAPYDPGVTLTQALVQANPVSPVTKTLDPNVGPDNCNPPYAIGPVQNQ
jgi:hypothetical protein